MKGNCPTAGYLQILKQILKPGLAMPRQTHGSQTSFIQFSALRLIRTLQTAVPSSVKVVVKIIPAGRLIADRWISKE
ncbi:MAG: hypothetical protein HC771_13685 [Synechococcales cyanobacterium CRU_2_2]|nr:hypothetical protein [Synechococcales cyanobacterium CRU_2_2]